MIDYGQMKRYINDFIHNAIIHPLMVILPVEKATKLHDWHANKVFGPQRFDELSLELNGGKKTVMYNPPHPGETLKMLCIEPLGLTVGEAAEKLGVSRKTLSQIINGHSRITPEMAIRLSKAFNTTPESWLQEQMQYDLWKASLEADSIHVKPVVPTNDSMNLV